MVHAPDADDMLDQLEATYVLGEVLGRGGMGIVYAATLRTLDRRLAVKVPHPELMTSAFVAHRFRIEALAGARLSHKNLPRVLDSGGGAGGAPYIVMEFIPGRRLDNLLGDEDAFDTRAAVTLVRQILAALEAAHSGGVIHADIKTANVLVETRADGGLVARVIDFGLARLRDEPFELDVRVLSGTPDYLAPELVQGGVPSVASDIYAAGVVLYELLTGTTPFGGGSSSDIMNRHVADAVVPPTLRCPDLHVSRTLEAAITRALAKQPAERFATAAEFAAALQGAPAASNRPPRQFARGTLPQAAFSTEATTRSWLRERTTRVLAGDEI
jgi:serine/threonine-protein kinase